MTADREIAGLWWLPENPNNKWVGNLVLQAKQSPRLKFTMPKGFETKLPDTPAVMHGCDQHGKHITLLHLSQTEATSSSALSQITYSAGYAILGIDLPNVEAFEVQSVILHVQHLYDWVNASGFEWREPSPDEVTLSYRTPQTMTFNLDGDLTIEMCPSFSYRRGRESRLEEDTYLKFNSRRGLGIADCKALLNPIRHLLHFAVLQPIYPLRVQCIKDGHGVKLNNDFFPHEIDLCWALNRDRVDPVWRDDLWVFRFSDVQPRFAEFFGQWLKYEKKFDEAFSNYFATVYHSLPPTLAHLCLTQALEAYHGIKFQSHEEREFERKMRELAETHKEQLVGLVDDPAEFAMTVRDNRNYYTHHNPKWRDGGRVVSGASLMRLNEKLRLICQMCVLADNGIPSNRFNRLRRQLASKIVEYA